MAAAEAEAPGTGRSAQSGPVYDGFISYSHAADDLLAPRLQAGLQRFAKPWWKRRALKVFRDESSLSANPHLWSSITEALDSSEWFVLLLSPDAASSEWVGREIEHWLEHRDSARILPVITAGDFGWVDGDVSGSSVPPALRGVFTDEPRWVDLRFAKDDEQLDLKNPEFSSAVADLASPLRGIPKDELQSEEVKQHRRTIRTAWAAGILVAGLAVAAVLFGIQSVSNARRAEANAQAEAEQRSEAEAQREIAQEEAERADRQAQIARSRELAAAAASVLEADPELSSLLAILSIRRLPANAAPSVESIRTLRVADRSNLLRLRLSTGPGPSRQRVDVTPDGEMAVYLNSVANTVTAIHTSSGDTVWTRSFTEEVFSPLELALSPDGSTLAVQVVELADSPDQILVLSTATGETISTLSVPCTIIELDFPWPDDPFSGDGTIFAFRTGTPECGTDPEAGWVTFVDTTTWAEVNRLEVPGWYEQVSFAQRADRIIVTDLVNKQIEVRTFPELEVIATFDRASDPAISPDGDRVAFIGGGGSLRYSIYDVETGDLKGYAEGQDLFAGPAVFSPDGETLAVFTRSHDVLVDGHDGTLIRRIGVREPTGDGVFAGDGSTLVTVDEDRGILRIWELDHATAVGTRLGTDPDVTYHLNPDPVIHGPSAAVLGLNLSADRPVIGLHLIDETTGSTLQTIEAINAAQLPDGLFVVVPAEATVRADNGEPDTLMRGLAVWDPNVGSLTPITECSVSVADYFNPNVDIPLCDDGEPAFAVDGTRPQLFVSPNGSRIAAISAVVDGHRLLRVWDTQSLNVVQTMQVDPRTLLMALGDTWVALADGLELRPVIYAIDNGDVLADLTTGSLEDPPISYPNSYGKLIEEGRYLLSRAATQVVVLDTTTWTEVARWDAHEGQVRGIASSPAGTLLATAGEDEAVRIWDLTGLILNEGLEPGQAPTLLDEIPTEVASGIRWISEDLIGLAIRRPGRWFTVSLNADMLLDQVLSRLTRSFTARECQTYNIDPCPTLEELKGS